MSKPLKTIEIKLERTIAAPPAEVFDSWLNPKVPGTPWYEGDDLVLNAEVNGLFYWLIHETAHFGRFTKLDRAELCIQHSWMSRYTSGEETTVTVTFAKKGSETLMTIFHTGLPDDDKSPGHKEGWTHFLDKLSDHFASKRP
jgi:uncharacterized protein YndB with AHSA1/START domain